MFNFGVKKNMLGLSYSNHVKSTSFLNVVPVLERSGGFLHLATVGFLHLGNQGTCSNHEPRRGNRVYDTSVLPCVLVWCSGRWGGFLVGKNRMDQVWSLLGVFFFLFGQLVISHWKNLWESGWFIWFWFLSSSFRFGNPRDCKGTP